MLLLAHVYYVGLFVEWASDRVAKSEQEGEWD